MQLGKYKVFHDWRARKLGIKKYTTAERLVVKYSKVSDPHTSRNVVIQFSFAPRIWVWILRRRPLEVVAVWMLRRVEMSLGDYGAGYQTLNTAFVCLFCFPLQHCQLKALARKQWLLTLNVSIYMFHTTNAPMPVLFPFTTAWSSIVTLLAQHASLLSE
jgi:hypothetical protein